MGNSGLQSKILPLQSELLSLRFISMVDLKLVADPAFSRGEEAQTPLEGGGTKLLCDQFYSENCREIRRILAERGGASLVAPRSANAEHNWTE